MNVAYSYVSLEKAKELLGVSEKDLIHAGAQDQIQICVNIYGRSSGQKLRRVEPLPCVTDKDEIHPEDREFLNWWNRCNSPMPDGVYELGRGELRFLEMPEAKEFELHEAFKRDELGWWRIEFLQDITITQADLVILSGEIERVSASCGPDSDALEKPLNTRERNTLLTIIAALCKEAKLDHTKSAKTANLIQSTAARMGLSIGESTIEGHLKKIPNALASRMK